MPAKDPWKGFFYYPGRTRIPHDSFITELVFAHPNELIVLSLSSQDERQVQVNTAAASLVVNFLVGVPASVVSSLKSELYSGAIVSFFHPIDPHPYTIKTSGVLPLSTSLSPQVNSGDLPSSIEIAEMTVLPGVLTPDQQEGASVVTHGEKELGVISFREMVERRVESWVENE